MGKSASPYRAEHNMMSAICEKMNIDENLYETFVFFRVQMKIKFIGITLE